MNSELQIFNNEEFGEIRTVTIDGEPWLVGKDVATALGYSDPSSAVSKNVGEDDKTTLLLEQAGSNYKSKTSVINESGLYSLILSSKLPSAKKFKHWVTSEVLPAIRKTGSYNMGGEPQPQELSKQEYLELIKTVTSCDEGRFQVIASILKHMGVLDSFSMKEEPNSSKKSQHVPGLNNTSDYLLQIVNNFLKNINVTGKPTSEVYGEYAAYCECHSIDPVSKIVFSKYVNKLLGTQVTHKKINSITKRVFTY